MRFATYCLTAGALLATAPAALAQPTPTFTRDIAPIFQAKCEACHRADQMAPMSLVTYEEARPWAKSIAARVGGRQMPPWYIDKTVGIQKFKSDRSLSEAQIDTIVRWAAAGAPKGDPNDMPPPVKWPDESKWLEAATLVPPVVRFEPTGPAFTGPPNEVAARFVAAPGAPLPLTVYVSDEGPKLNVEPPQARARSSSGAATNTYVDVTVRSAATTSR